MDILNEINEEQQRCLVTKMAENLWCFPVLAVTKKNKKLKLGAFGLQLAHHFRYENRVRVGSVIRQLQKEYRFVSTNEVFPSYLHFDSSELPTQRDEEGEFRELMAKGQRKLQQ